MMFDPAALDFSSGEHLLLTVDKQFVRPVVGQIRERLGLALLSSGLRSALGGCFRPSSSLAEGPGPIGFLVSDHRSSPPAAFGPMTSIPDLALGFEPDGREGAPPREDGRPGALRPASLTDTGLAGTRTGARPVDRHHPEDRP